MNNQIGPTVKHVWNDAMHRLNIFWGFVINTTAYHLDQYNLHLLYTKELHGRAMVNHGYWFKNDNFI